MCACVCVGGGGGGAKCGHPQGWAAASLIIASI